MSRIFGIGTDIAKNARFEEILLKNIRDRFLARVLHSREIQDFNNKKDFKSQARFVASRWAYKEALVKACGRKDLQYSAICLSKTENGKPKVELEKTNKMILENELGVKTIHVSISHEDDFSLAFVILEI